MSFNCVAMFAAEDGATPATWQPVIEGKMATVSVAKALFEQKEGKYFLAGVRVTNKTDGEIGVDLRSRRYCVRINQWSVIDTAERGIINERRIVRPLSTEADQTSLVTAFRAGKLVRIPAGKSVDYYCPFIGAERDSNRDAVEKLPTKFVILSMDGELRVTNGEQSESLRCGEPGEADVSIARPVPWRNVPSGGRIVSDDSATDADKAPVDASTVDEICLTPSEQNGWMIRFFPDGSGHAQFGSARGDRANLPKGSVHFGALLNAVYRLKSDKQLEQQSTIAVSFNDATNAEFPVIDDTLFRYLIESFEEQWQVGVGRKHFEILRRQHPIFQDDMLVHTWQPVIEGKMATLAVAKALFEQNDSKGFLARIRVTNKTDREIGVDLRNRWNCVRVNQWTAIDTAKRTDIDEERDNPSPFTDEDQARLRTAFRAGDLLRIRAWKSVDYYCPFNGGEEASNRAAVEKLQSKFVVLSMDGELRMTNGEQSESLRCGEPGEADVTIVRPVPWHTVPSGGRIVSDDGVAGADKSPVDTSVVTDIWLIPAKPSSGWLIRFFPDGSAHAQYGSALGDAAHLPKGSVNFESLLRAAYRLKSDSRVERLSTILVSFKDAPNAAFSVNDDTLFRYLIDSFDKKWQPELGSSRFDELRHKYSIYRDEMPADNPQP